MSLNACPEPLKYNPALNSAAPAVMASPPEVIVTPLPMDSTVEPPRANVKLPIVPVAVPVPNVMLPLSPADADAVAKTMLPLPGPAPVAMLMPPLAPDVAVPDDRVTAPAAAEVPRAVPNTIASPFVLVTVTPDAVTAAVEPNEKLIVSTPLTAHVDAPSDDKVVPAADLTSTSPSVVPVPPCSSTDPPLVVVLEPPVIRTAPPVTPEPPLMETAPPVLVVPVAAPPTTDTTPAT